MEEEVVRGGAEEGQISLVALLEAAKHRIGLILAIVVVMTVIGGIFGKFFVKTKYSSSGEVIVMMMTDDESENKTSSTTAYQYSVYLAETINSSLLKSDLVMKNAAETLKAEHGISIRTSELKSGLTSSVSQNRGIAISMKFTSSYEQADVILNTVINTLVKELNSKDGDGNYKWELFGNSVRITSAPSAVSNDSRSKVLKYLAIFCVIGLVIAAVFIVIVVITDDTYKSKEQFEKDTGIEVLASLENIALAKEKKE